jgi:hypothetical protein
MYSDEEFIFICNSELTMSKACEKLWLHFNTFKRKAVKLWCYNPNPAWKWTTKNKWFKISLDEILEWKHWYYQTWKLKKRLINNNIIENKCFICWIVDWLWKKISLELDHIDWNRFNHQFNNLQLLCPNCHSQTSTYRWKNVKKIKNKEV